MTTRETIMGKRCSWKRAAPVPRDPIQGLVRMPGDALTTPLRVTQPGNCDQLRQGHFYPPIMMCETILNQVGDGGMRLKLLSLAMFYLGDNCDWRGPLESCRGGFESKCFDWSSLFCRTPPGLWALGPQASIPDQTTDALEGNEDQMLKTIVRY